jgi:hypothetical protein
MTAVHVTADAEPGTAWPLPPRPTTRRGPMPV